MNEPLDYLAIGHVTLDRQPDGAALPGGTVLYAALQAARLGLRAGIVTAGRASDLDPLLAPYRAELTVHLAPAPATTTFTNVGLGAARRQTVHAWAGAVEAGALPSGVTGARIVHLAPVAREIVPSILAHLPTGRLLGATPQGWLRRWDADGVVRPVPLDLPDALLARLDVLVLSETEQAQAEAAIAAVRARGGIVAVTRGAAGCLVHAPGASFTAPALPVTIVDDTGAGDVFAAAFFVALAEGRDVRHAARFANAAAGLSIRGRGVTGIATREAVERACSTLSTQHSGLRTWH